MKDIFSKLKIMERETIIFLTASLVCAVCITIFLGYYFKSYHNPYMMKEIVDLSENWQYQTEQSELMALDNLRTGPMLPGGETMTMYKTLDIGLPDAAIMIRANHQAVNVYLDETTLLLDKNFVPGQNPGMAFHFIPLPANYLHKTLKIEITSPYALYSGRTSPILLGTIPSLEAYAVSSSMNSLILMAMCLFLGGFTVALTILQALKGFIDRQNLALGVFAIIWALYYVCTEYIVFMFFTPTQVSVLSLGLYFSFQIPLTLFLYFSFEHYKKWMIPAVILPAVFVTTAFTLQFLEIMDLPQFLNINNILLTGLIYSTVLSVLEAIKKKNRLMMIIALFLIAAYASMLYNFDVFYKRHGVVPYSYKDTYFLLILAVLIYNIQQFFSRYYLQRQHGKLLSLQNRLAKESYDNIKTHLQAMGSLKHEIRNHLAVMQTYLQDGLYEEARDYLAQYTGQTGAVTNTIFHDNFLINAVIGNLYQRAQESGVMVELNLKATPGRIADPDLYSILTNILENALEACEDLQSDRKRFINLAISRRDPYFIIVCENSKEGEIISINGKIQTKKTAKGHGYGLWTIKQIVDAYGGMMETEYDEDTFTVTVALKDN